MMGANRIGLLETGVSTFFTRRHIDPLGLEGEHEHTWCITAWWPGEPLRDGRALKAGLTMLLDALPETLPGELWSGEAIARRVALLVGVIRVEVDREAEGYHARAIL